MALRRGFKSDANWYARQMRFELGLAPHAPLCPWRLSEHLEYQVRAVSEFVECDQKAVEYLHSEAGQKEFSAITLYAEGLRLIIHNDAHHRYRQAANIAHELAHGILLHTPAPLTDATGARLFNREQEDEAHWLGPALLISEEAALEIVTKRQPLPEAREIYGVSDELLRMRLQVTGAYARIARRFAA